jgi:hypothetical protein
LAAFYIVTSDRELTLILGTVSIGAIFLSGIVVNSVVLPLFGKSAYSAFAVLAVVVCELLTIPLVASDIWYAALGFLIGSFVGFLVSYSVTVRCVNNFGFYLFQFVTINTLKHFNRRRSVLS